MALGLLASYSLLTAHLGLAATAPAIVNGANIAEQTVYGGENPNKSPSS